MLYILFFSFLIALMVAVGIKPKAWESHIHLIDVEWLDCSDKFKLIARWGVK